MFEDFAKDVKIPKDIKKEFLENLKTIMTDFYKDKELDDFVVGFFNKHGNDIYDYHRKTFTDEELWKSILISKLPEFQKMIKFQIDCQEFTTKLAMSYMEELDKQELDKQEKINREIMKKDFEREIYKQCDEEDEQESKDKEITNKNYAREFFKKCDGEEDGWTT